ncbi:MAG: hypothetical protein H7836_12450 [Magnetococcus sp. YQC-3]
MSNILNDINSLIEEALHKIIPHAINTATGATIGAIRGYTSGGTSGAIIGAAEGAKGSMIASGVGIASQKLHKMAAEAAAKRQQQGNS